MTMEDIISQPFSENNFSDFIEKLDFVLADSSEYTQIDDDLRYKVLSNKRESEDDHSQVKVIILKSEKPIGNARVKYNHILEKITENNTLDMALMATFSQNSDNWKLSLVATNREGETITSSKRYTFELGKNIPVKTAIAQLSLLNQNSTKQDYIDAFSVEKLTKEFYNGVVGVYYKLLSDYLTYPTNNDNDKKEFAIRLIGRILFIKFLNKKLFVPDDIFNVTKDYYHSKLEPLFFEQLNTTKSDRKEQFKNDTVPFLNGGLFEPLHLDYYAYNEISECSQHINTLKIDDAFFKDFYEHLDQYNFTIDENSIDDNELSIDPEMLGKVFENLLAEVNPETSQNARKSTGSYYTPREIVNYMCKSSIDTYLEDKDDKLQALKAIKVLDPACGSGAFPMGLLHEIIKQRVALGDTTPMLELKKEIIKDNIFGVDIQPMAIEISKLRFFLSIIVDEDDTPEPLPNLEFKFVCANSLLPLAKNTVLSSQDYFDHQAKLKKLRSDYFDTYATSKKDIKEEYEKTQKQLFDEIVALSVGEALDSSLANYNPFNPVSVAGFFDSDFMFNIKDGFDIIIGNPPYFRLEANYPNFIFYKKNYLVSTKGKINIYKLFYEKGISCLKNNGILSYITPNTYLTSNDSTPLRKLMLDNLFIIQIIEYDEKDKVFENVTQAVTTFLAKKTKHTGKMTIVTKKHGVIQELQSEFYDNKEKILIHDNKVIRKMKANELRLKDLFDIYQGEINLTVKKKFLANEPQLNYVKMWRGIQVGKYSPVKVQQIDYCDINASDRIRHKVKRIVMQQVSNQSLSFRTKAFISDENYLCGNSTNYLVSKDGCNLLVYLGIINSNVFNYFFNYFSFTNHLTVGELSEIPIPKISPEAQKPFEILVDYVMFLKQQEFNQNDDLKFAKDRLMVSFFERLIDCMVYELYFADELHKENKYFIEPLQKESLLDVQNMDNKLEGIRAIFEKLNDKNHIIKKNMYFIDSVEIVRIIEGKENANN